MNEQIKNSVNVNSMFGVISAGGDEMRAGMARMAGVISPASDGLSFDERVKIAIEVCSERSLNPSMYMIETASSTGADNKNKADSADSADEAAKGDFINYINDKIDTLDPQELDGFFTELKAINKFFSTDEGRERFELLLEFENKQQFANTLIAASFKRIADMIGLTPDSEEMFGRSFNVEFDAENIEHLATILWYLDITIRLVNERSDAGSAAVNAQETLGMTASPDLLAQDDPAELAELSAALRREKFNLEMALRFVGLHEMIATMVAERTDKNISIGIPQASDPASLGMWTSDTVKAFASLIKEELTSAMDRVRAITSGQAQMTDIEKAAIRLGAIKSEILSGALDGNSRLNRTAFEKASAELNAAMMKNAAEKVNAGVNTASVKMDNVNTANINAANVKVDNANTANINTANVKVDNVNTANINTANVKVDSINTANVNTANVNTANVNTVNVKVDSVNTANANINTDNANTATKSAADGFELPLSAKESSNKKAAAAIEAANRRAFESVAVTAKSVSGNDTELPVSVKESANKKAADVVASAVKNAADAPVAKVHTAEAAKINAVAAGTDVPVSAMESANKKSQVKSVSVDNAKPVNVNSVKAADGANVLTAEKANIAGKPETLAQNVFAVKAEQHVAADKHHAVNPAIAQPADHAGAPVANAPAANASSNNVLLSGMMVAADTVEAGAESESADSSEPAAGIDTSNKSTAAADQADKARATMSRVDQEAIIRQLTEKIHYAVRAGAHEFRVTLRPEALGDVRMSIRIQGDVVLARMVVENSQVKAVVESNMQSLKDALEKHNLHVGAFSVDVGSDSGTSHRQTWREMAEEAGISMSRKFKDGIGGAADGSGEVENDPLNGEPGSDTGRRFGNNTFEYFI